jgi:hypothetical protein
MGKNDLIYERGKMDRTAYYFLCYQRQCAGYGDRVTGSKTAGSEAALQARVASFTQ